MKWKKKVKWKYVSFHIQYRIIREVSYLTFFHVETGNLIRKSSLLFSFSWKVFEYKSAYENKKKEYIWKLCLYQNSLIIRNTLKSL